ncbi:MAG TPA: O-antigen ligase family protein [Motilibacteraceae bacterium]|nr:O-antigen ligase family protein [Motilibacteraceae bacterium]
MVPHLAGLGALAWWGLPLTHASGGRSGYALATALLVLVPAFAVLRPLRLVPRREVVLALAPAVAAFVVCVVAPTHFDGLDDAASFAYAGLLYLVLRAYASTVERRRLVLAGVMLIGLEQFNQGWLAWWGADDPSKLFQGTFYWHNQAAAFLVGACAVAITAAVLAVDRARWLGRITAPLLATGVVLTGSRANYALLLGCWAGVLLIGAWRRRGVRAALALPLATYLLLRLVTSRFVLDVQGGPWSVLERRQAGQGVGGSGEARLFFWRAAVDLWERHPLTGAGFDSFGSAGVPFMPAGAGLSSLVHNGFVQALSDGGLVLAVPLALATLLAWARSLRVGAEDVLARSSALDWDKVAPAVALCPLLVHSAVDFDWSYPALLAFLAVLASVARSSDSPRPVVDQVAQGTGRRALPAVVAVAVLVACAILAATASTSVRYPAMPVPLALRPVAAVADHSPSGLRGPGDCRKALSSQDRQVVQEALACTEAAAADAPSLQLQRAAALTRLGRPDEAVRLAEGAAAQDPAHWTVRLLLAQVLDLAGQQDRARDIVMAVRVDRVAHGSAQDLQLVDRALAALNGANLQIAPAVTDGSQEAAPDGSAG